MANTGIRRLDDSMQKTNELLHKIDDKLGWDDMNKTYSATRAVLQATRDRLQPEEATDFASQLPMVLSGVFYEGYKISDKPLKIGKEQYIQTIRENMTNQADDPERIAKVVLSVIGDKISPGQITDMMSNMPKDIQSLVLASMME